MKYYIFRNNTIDFFFDAKECAFSGYDDIAIVPSDAEKYIWFYQIPYCVIDEHSVDMVRSYAHKFDFVYSQIQNGKEIIVFTLCDIGETKITSSDLLSMKLLLSSILMLFLLQYSTRTSR